MIYATQLTGDIRPSISVELYFQGPALSYTAIRLYGSEARSASGPPRPRWLVVTKTSPPRALYHEIGLCTSCLYEQLVIAQIEGGSLASCK